MLLKCILENEVNEKAQVLHEISEEDAENLQSDNLKMSDQQVKKGMKYFPQDYRVRHEGHKKRRNENSQSSFNGSCISINIADGNELKFDQKPRFLFVQLNELHGTGQYQEWHETARWVKYEENVEEGADRWGQPHISSLSFHSLLNVRRCLESGVVMLDVEEKDFQQVVFRAVKKVNNSNFLNH